MAAHTADNSAHGHHEPHGEKHYIKIYFYWLLPLLIASIIGPEIGIRWLTLITAFGIAIVKAWIVAAYFMHLKVEKKYISYMMCSMLLMMLLFFMAVAPDVLHTHGRNWINTSAVQLIQNHEKFGADAANLPEHRPTGAPPISPGASAEKPASGHK